MQGPILVPALLLGLGAGLAAQDDAAGRLADLQQLVDFVREKHPEANTRATGTAWDAAVTAARAAAATDDARFYVAALGIVAQLQDGHSLLLPPADTSSHPIDFEFFGEDLYVVAAAPVAAAAVGKRVVAIGQREIGDVLRRLRPMFGWDNDAGATVFAELMLTLPPVLAALDLGEAMPLAVVADDAPAGTEATLVPMPPPVAGRLGAPPAADWVQVPRTAAFAESHPEKPFWSEYLRDRDLVYCRLRRMEDVRDGEPFAEFCARAFRMVHAQLAGKLVVDLRGNPGGTNDILPPLLDGAQAVDGACQLFVLTDRHTFSAAMNCATRLERRTQALFVGEPTGARPNHCGDATTRLLPHTRFRLRCSTRRWRDSEPADDRPWILPDLPVPNTFADWVAGNDPGLDAIAQWQPPENAPAPGRAAAAPRWQRASQLAGWPPGAPAAK